MDPPRGGPWLAAQTLNPLPPLTLSVLTDIDHLVNYHIFANEVQMVPLFQSASAAAGRPITNLCAIIDMGGMTLKLSTAVTRSYITRMIGIDSKHYPETLGRMFIINVPTIFSIAWALIAPFLDERTQNKIEIISSESAWKKRLRECVDADKLPVEYGGTLDVPVFPPSRTRQTAVDAGKSFEELTDAVAAGTSVTFKWFSRPGDMIFSVAFERTGAAGRVVLEAPADHPTCEKKQVVLTLKAPADGRFVCTWNNSKGWWRRELFHRWDVTDSATGKPLRAAA